MFLQEPGMPPIPMAQHIFQAKHYIVATRVYFVCPEASGLAISPPYDLGALAGLLEMKARETAAEKQTAPASLHTRWHWKST